MIYLLKRLEVFGFDENTGHVVRARNPKGARRMVASLAKDEGEAVWLDEKRSSCTPVSPDGPAFVFLSAGSGA